MKHSENKLKQVGLSKSLIGRCDCGKKHKFGYSEIIKNSLKEDYILLNNSYKCPRCNAIYDGISPNNKSNWYENMNPLGIALISCLIIGIFFSGFKLINILTTSTQNQPSYYETGDIEDMTDEELKDYIKWKLKQDN